MSERPYRRKGLKAATLLIASLAAATPAWSETAETHSAAIERFEPVPYAIFKGLHQPGGNLPFLLKRDYAAAFAFYSRRNFRPVWHERGVPTGRARAIETLFERSGEHGLNPVSYPVFLNDKGYGHARDLAASEILMTLSVLEYGRHAASGRVTPQSVSASIAQAPKLPDPIAILDDVSSAQDPSARLEAMHPRHPQYLALHKALRAEIAPKEAVHAVPVPSGQTLRVGMADPAVAILRARLGVLRNPLTTDIFDEEVAEVVRAFQQERGLRPDALVGPRTIAALNNEGTTDRTAILIANMERWRWMPRTLGADHVLVNIPHYSVTVQRGGDPIYSGRVVVGKARHKTPVFSDEIEHVVVNPYWNVPRSIANNEILPRLQDNPQYGYKYEIIHASGSRVDPHAVNWWRYSGGGDLPFRFRQPPGPRNALGSVKFLFPNKHAVYLHDTPSRSLFNRRERAFSHGCVRLHEPMAFADAIFATEPKWSGRRLQGMVGGKENWISLKRAIPVHLVYFTAWAGPDGTITYRRDIYGHDRRTAKALAR